MSFTYRAKLDFGPAFEPVKTCPDCGSADIKAVVDAERTNFCCTACGACWHLQLGRIARADTMHRATGG
ncbi:TFIIB-type zinc ribbon-containing protein [Qaidamihabitans albus]|uniref:TFIIB-type zinc ribbon-containing protein n=1 Tax=Qaidamihabitans albus TaxID=2795733 RepID=UPI0018F1BC69|nr:TFIIB-type zinc ribbon-containing protein [Qaidamihabitans albus]